MTRRKKGLNRLKGGPSGTARNDDAVYVSIYCRGTVKKPHEKWRIASFRRDDHEGESFWTESDTGYAESGSLVLIRVYPPASQWLDGNEYIHRDSDGAAVIDGQRDAEVFYRDTFRTAWILKCKTCGFAHKIASPRIAYPVLDVLAQTLALDSVVETPVREFCGRLLKARREAQ